MVTPTLSLNYPDVQSGRVRLLAVTSDRHALEAFKKAVLQEAQLQAMTADDEVLKIEYSEELRKLERLLNVLIPDEEPEGGNNG